MSGLQCRRPLPHSLPTLLLPQAIFGLATDNNLYVNDGYATSIFKTGIGKSILATENSRERAQFILEAKEAVKQGRVMDALGVEKLKGLEPGCHFERLHKKC
ncbi:hypothetical protein BDA96_04G138500 [Sorghum bicolor]|uniref:Uncharacterized protein n=1 Tax=Sorghum bicolor TaxID=4558 RepID=A0A921R4G8_SORBI|nr:hypothetical protein BDA96_04G138500 [Sorghum bicolor]